MAVSYIHIYFTYRLDPTMYNVGSKSFKLYLHILSSSLPRPSRTNNVQKFYNFTFSLIVGNRVSLQKHHYDDRMIHRFRKPSISQSLSIAGKLVEHVDKCILVRPRTKVLDRIIQGAIDLPLHLDLIRATFIPSLKCLYKLIAQLLW